MKEKTLEKIAKHLDIRFPVATFSKDLEISKGVVSEYYNCKKIVSKNFIERLENFYEIKYKDFQEPKNLLSLRSLSDYSDLEVIKHLKDNINSFILNPAFQELISSIPWISKIGDVEREMEEMKKKIEKLSNKESQV